MRRSAKTASPPRGLPWILRSPSEFLSAFACFSPSEFLSAFACFSPMGSACSRQVSPRADDDDDVMEWHASDSETTVAAVARLEALASVQANTEGDTETPGTDENTLGPDGCRLAYSSVLAVKSSSEAQTLLAHVFTQALTKNPPKEIGGILFYDEKTSALVQVLEGPAAAVRSLFNEKIKLDPRHTSVKLLWDRKAQTRRFEGFGMQLGTNPKDVLQDAKELLQLTYVSQLTAPDRTLAYKHIEDILAVAIVKNPKLKIGGALFLNPRTYQVLQALEGPEAAVRGLYDRIAQDPRHSSCAIVSAVQVKARTYDQWGMLQGDLTDWSSIASGKQPMHKVVNRRRRAREEMDEDGGSKGGSDGSSGAQPASTPTLKGEVQMGPEGPVVVPLPPTSC